MSLATIKAGAAFLEVFAQDKTKPGLDQVQARLRAFGAVVTALGASISAASAAGFASIRFAANEFTTFGDSIDKFAARTGVTTDWAQTFRVAASLAGTSIQDVEKAIRKMQQTLGRTGQLKGMSPEEQFLAIADQLSKIEDPTERAAKAMEIFGRSGTMLLPMIANGAADIRKQFEWLSNNGLLLSPQDIQVAAQLNDAWDLLNLTWMQTVRVVGAAIAPTLVSIVSGITNLMTWVTTFIKNNKELFNTLVLVGAGIVAAGAVIGPLLVALGGLAFLLAALPSIVAGITLAWGLLTATFAAVLSPVGLIVTAVVALVALLPVLAYVLDDVIAGGAGLKFLSDAFGELWRIASSAITGIFNAIASGNWSLAGAIAMAGLNTAFVTGWAWLKMGFHDFGTWLLGFLSDLLGSRAVGIILSGMRAVIDMINQGLEALGQETMDTTSFDNLIANSDDTAKFKKELARQNKAYRASVQQDIDTAKWGQKLLEDQAAKETAVNKKKTEDTMRGPIIPELHQRISTGALSAAAVGRLGQNIPQFDKLETIASDQLDILAKIEENTADGGPEFGE